MAITHLGSKRIQGTKVDRKVDSLGSSADGTNTGIILSDGHIKQSIGSHTGNNGGNYYRAGYRALGSTLNTNWVFRFRYKPTALNSNSGNRDGDGMGIFITDRAYEDNVNDGSVGTTKAIGYAFRSKDSNTTWYYNAYAGTSSSSDSGVMHHSGGQTDFSDQATVDEEYYVEIIKNGTTVTVTQRSGSHSASATETETLTTSLSGFTHINIISFDGNGGTQPVIEAEIRDIELWDNTTSASGTATWSGISDFTHGTGTTGNDYKLGSGSYSFDGSNDYVELGDNMLLGASAFTVAGWINPTTVQSGIVWSQWSGTADSRIIHFYTDVDSGKLYIIGGLRNGSSGANIYAGDGWEAELTMNAWNHVAVSFDGSAGELKLYLNGTLRDTVSSGLPSTTQSGTTSNKPLIGKYYSNSSYFAGKIDDMGIWKRVLSATEISTLCGSTGSLDSNDFDNVYGSTQFARGFKVATSSSALKDKKVKAVTFYVKKNGSATGTAYAKIYNGTTVVETNTTGTNLDVSTLGTSDYTAHKFEFTGNTTLDTGYSVVYYFDGGTGSAYTQIRRQGSDVYDGVNTIYRKYHSSAWADDSGTDAKFILEFADPQLVSSLSNKSELKAYYSMDSVDEAITPTYTQLFENASDSSLTGDNNTGGSSYFNVDSTVADALYIDPRRSSSIFGQTWDLGTTVSETAWVLRAKYNITSLDNSGDTVRLFFGINNQNSTVGAGDGSNKFIGVANAINSSFAQWYRLSVKGNTLDVGEASQRSLTTETLYIEIIRKSGTKYSVRLTNNSDFTGGTFIDDQDVGANGGSGSTSSMGLRYVWWSNINVNGNQNAHQQGNFEYVKVWDGVTSVPNCKNDFSSTSELDGYTNLPVNTIFEQTDDTPSYWWYNGTSWVLDGTTLCNTDMTTSYTGYTGNTGDFSYDSSENGIKIDTSSNNKIIVKTLSKTLSKSGKWVARFKVKRNTGDAGDGWGIAFTSSSASTVSQIQSGGYFYGLGFYINNGSTSGDANSTASAKKSNGSDDGSSSSNMTTDVSIGDNLYIELRHLSDTSFICTAFSDSTFKTSKGSVTRTYSEQEYDYDQIAFWTKWGSSAHKGIFEDLEVQSGTSEWLE